MTFPAHDSPDTSLDRPAPQVTHPAATEELVSATRALVTTQRTADAPADVLEQATALVRDADRAPRTTRGRRHPGAERAARRVPRS